MDPIRDERIKYALKERQELRSKRKALRDLEDVADVLKTPSGRRFYWRILSESKVMSASFVPGHNDVTFFHEGKRDIGIILMTEVLRADPALFLQMQREAESEARQEKAENDKIRETIENE